MSNQITTAFVQQYSNNVQMLSQQKGSLLRNSVRIESVVGKNAFFDQVGSVAAVLRTTRHAETPQLDTPHSRRRVSLADVHFVFNPSNHDYTHGFFLADCIKTHFRQASNITFDCSLSHRKAFRYGENLIGTTHGDGAKQQDLPLLLATEFPMDWSLTKHTNCSK